VQVASFTRALPGDIAELKAPHPRPVKSYSDLFRIFFDLQGQQSAVRADQ